MLNFGNSEVTLTNLNITNGNNTSIDGIAIYSLSSNIAITNSSFTNLNSMIGSVVYTTHVLEAGTVK